VSDVTTQTNCTIDGCAGEVIARGWCRKHYSRWYKNGSPATLLQEHNPAAKHEWVAAVSRSTTDECIDWPWATSHGYGHLRSSDGRYPRVHVLVCEIAHGPKLAGKEVAHSCGRRCCCNPRHLRWATPKENHADKATHNTILSADRSPNAKLNWDAVHLIRLRYGRESCSQAALAQMFGVSRSTVGKVLAGKTWRTNEAA
jgi:hypothetical protein